VAICTTMAPTKAADGARVQFGKPGSLPKIGIIGLSNVGKTTTFNVLTNSTAETSTELFSTKTPAEATGAIPDDRVKRLVTAFNAKAENSATVTLWDLPALVPNAHKGEGLGNSFLSSAAPCDGLVVVCRAFTGDENKIAHSEGEVDPVRDLDIVMKELIAKDLEEMSKAMEAQKKVKPSPKDKSPKDDLEALKKADETLKQGTPLGSRTDWSSKEVETLSKHQLLTTKPCIFLVNLSEKDFARQKNKFLPKIHAWVQEKAPGSQMVPYSAEFEQKFGGMKSTEEQQKYLEDLGTKNGKSMREKILRSSCETLNVQSFFTCGPDEVRAWFFPQGIKAPQAAGLIHPDFERGFVCMEVYKFEDFAEHGSEAEIKAANKFMQQGKNYEVQDGDVCFIKFNVAAKTK